MSASPAGLLRALIDLFDQFWATATPVVGSGHTATLEEAGLGDRRRVARRDVVGEESRIGTAERALSGDD